MVDTSHRVAVGSRGREESPAPGDGVAVVPDVQGADRHLGLLSALAKVESGLVGEGDGAKLEELSLVTENQGCTEFRSFVGRNLQGCQP